MKRIARHRQIPKHIYNAKNELRTIREKTKRKYISLLKKIIIINISIMYIFSQNIFYYIYLFYFRESNRRAHSKPGTVPFIPERKRHVAQQEI